jgi:hypothetical protein
VIGKRSAQPDVVCPKRKRLPEETSPRDLYDTYKGTFDYLVANEPMGLIVLVIHCQFGGRPLISAVLNELLTGFARAPDVWFARHEELAQWALAADVDEHTYQSRFFAAGAQPPARARG